MKNFTTVYNNSRKQVLAERQAMYEAQKISIVNVLKENYMITKPISELPMDAQKEFAQKLLEYWSPKTGINKAGVKLLNENELTLSPRSYRQNNVQAVTEAFKLDIEPMIHKTLKETFVNNTVWEIISNRIKLGLD